MIEITKALLKAQKLITNAKKDSENPHFRSSYASLENVLDAVKDVANECEIVIVQSCGHDSEGHYVETKLMHISGEMVNSKIYLVLDKQNMQGLGSAITYGRRYSLAGVFGIGQEDDDGNTASEQGHKKAPAQAVKSFNSSPVKPVQRVHTAQAEQDYSYDEASHYQQTFPQEESKTSPGTHPSYIGYKVTVGKKYVGQTLTDISREEVTGYLNWLKTRDAGGKRMSPEEAIFALVAQEYIDAGKYDSSSYK